MVENFHLVWTKITAQSLLVGHVWPLAEDVSQRSNTSAIKGRTKGPGAPPAYLCLPKGPPLGDTTRNTWLAFCTTSFQTWNDKSEFQEISIYTHTCSWAIFHLSQGLYFRWVGLNPSHSQTDFAVYKLGLSQDEAIMWQRLCLCNPPMANKEGREDITGVGGTLSFVKFLLWARSFQNNFVK